MKRRDFVGGMAAASVLAAGCHQLPLASKKKWQKGATRWPICLDTATLSKDIPLEQKVELAAKAGFDAIEPWDRELKNHESQGKSLADLGKKINDLGMFVPSVIGMWGALAPEKVIFNKEIDDHKNRLRMVSEIGSKHIQVIPKFDRKDPLNHDTAAWAYGKVCEMAKDYNLEPAVIFLNFVKGLEKMSDAANIAKKSGVANPQIIPDTYHMFLSGSDENEILSYDKNFIAIYQFADAGQNVQPSNAKGLDGKRVLPGDGKLDLPKYLKPLIEIGYEGCISLELYNPEYRKRDPAPFLEEALRKTVSVVSEV